MRNFAAFVVVLSLMPVGCDRRKAEQPNWYDTALPYNVTEYIEFTDVNYDFPASDAAGIGALEGTVFPVAEYQTAFGPDDQYGTATCDTVTDNDLPTDVEGIVTIHPRYYFKTSGCDSDDEKFYGSFFIQDRTAGVFVLGDSKVAHFDQGDRVRIRVRGARTLFGLNTVVSYDVLKIERGPQAIYYREQTGAFAADDIGSVFRIRGVVVPNDEPRDDFFGTITVLYCPDTDYAFDDEGGVWQCEANNGQKYKVGLDQELGKRAIKYDLGSFIEVTGPVIYAYEEYSLVIMRVGQVSPWTPK